MFSIFTNKNKSPNYLGKLPFTCDIHSHILPGIDDGAPDINSSIQLIKGLMGMGISKAITTPHIIGDLYRNNNETIENALLLVEQTCKKEGIDFEISAAAEYMLDDYFLELLQSKTKLRTIKNKLLLTEFSYVNIPVSINELLFEMLTEGYQPILAHPERYFYFHQNYKAFSRLKEDGFLLQVNLLSLTGYYGKEVAKAAIYILKNNLADFVATDLHHERHLAALNSPESQGIFYKYLSKREFNNLDMFN